MKRDKTFWRLWPFHAKLHAAAPSFSHACIAIVAAGLIVLGIQAQQKADAAAAQAALTHLVQHTFDEAEITCLTNVAYHEARGKRVGTRELIAKVVLAVTGDPTSRLPRTVCDLAKVRGFFSDLKDAGNEHLKDRTWMKIHAEMTGVYYGARTLPRGWGCVRSFRVSDDVLERLKSEALAQLGFTKDAKGLKYFAAHRVPVDTRDGITFYSPRGGCRVPNKTT